VVARAREEAACAGGVGGIVPETVGEETFLEPGLDGEGGEQGRPCGDVDR
jgi:hypothetical protein